MINKYAYVFSNYNQNTIYLYFIYAIINKHYLEYLVVNN